MSDIACPKCGEAEDLRGSRRDDSVLEVACRRCGTSWERDLQRRCKLRGSTDLYYAPKPLWEKGRGEQRTPAGEVPAYSCYTCGGRDVTSSEPVPRGGEGSP